MKNRQWFGCALAAVPGYALARVLTCVLAGASLPALAQAQASVVDPDAVVAPVLYQSVFANGPKGVEMATTDWKKANAEVGQFKRGHVDILKWEASREAQPATPSEPPSPKTPAAPSGRQH